MKFLTYGLLFCFLAFNANAAFIEGLEDVPLPEGMSQRPSDNISFGNEESRLVDVVLFSKSLSCKEAQNFYIKNLPELGWIFQGKRQKTLVFQREEEVMDISCESAKPNLKLHLVVKSKI